MPARAVPTPPPRADASSSTGSGTTLSDVADAYWDQSASHHVYDALHDLIAGSDDTKVEFAKGVDQTEPAQTPAQISEAAREHDLDPDPRGDARQRGGELGRRRRVVLLAADGVHQEAAARRAALPRASTPTSRRAGTLRPSRCAQQLPSTPFVDLGGALDSATTPVLWDFVHTNEEGARLAAAAVYANLLPQLRARAGGAGPVKILGISAFYHDSRGRAGASTAQLVAAAQEERFTRKKHDAAFPEHAIAYCLRRGDVGSEGVDAVVYYDKPITTFVRLLKTYLRVGAEGHSGRSRRRCRTWTREKLWIPYEIERGLKRIGTQMPKDLWFTEHHESHAASAFFPSPFESAAILTFDGVGEWATSSVGVGRGNHIELQRQLNFPNSLGLLYSAFTYFCGFRVNSGEYKLMGLAPVRQARLRRRDPRAPARPAARRLVPHGDEVLQLPLAVSR